MSKKVLVTDKLDQAGLSILTQSCDVDYRPGTSPDELLKIISNYEGLLIRSQTQVTEQVLAEADNLKIIGRAGVGVDNINLEAATDKGVIVVNSPEGNTISAAEHTVALMMSAMRRVAAGNESVKSGKWERAKFVGHELASRTLGIVGLGKIGQRVGKVALALGMKVIGYDPFVSIEKVESLGFKKVELEDLFRAADVITLHVPKIPATQNMIRKETIATMKEGVCIVNCARGGLINEADLAEAIKTGKVGAAAIDVFETEPLDFSPLQKLADNVVLTPHLGASTREAQVNVAVDVAEQIRDVLNGGVARSAVNLPGLKPDMLNQIRAYLPLAEHMGAFVAQIINGAIKSVEIESLGNLSSKNTTGLKLSVLKGILGQRIEGVSFVNAPKLANDLGISIIESKSEDSGAYVDKLRIKLVTDKATRIIAGTVLQGDLPSIVEIDDFRVNILPEEHNIVTYHSDEPGKVAQITNILWQEEVNISSMHVGRHRDDSKAVMVLSVDSPVKDDCLENILKIDAIDVAKYVRMQGV